MPPPPVAAAAVAPLLIPGRPASGLFLLLKLLLEEALLAPSLFLRREAAHRWGGRGLGLAHFFDRALGALSFLRLLFLDASVLLLGRLLR
eukprot:3457375-Alexandrium_andersonii.AAC.1